MPPAGPRAPGWIRTRAQLSRPGSWGSLVPAHRAHRRAPRGWHTARRPSRSFFHRELHLDRRRAARPEPGPADGDGMNRHATRMRGARPRKTIGPIPMGKEKPVSGNKPWKSAGINAANEPGMRVNGRVISYNIPEGERPDGIKVRFKIR